MPILRSWPIVLILVTCLPQPTYPQCRDWTEVLTRSFLSTKASPADLRELSLLSAEQYSKEVSTHERQGVQEHIARSVASSPALPNLRSRLRQFYQIGAELYGMQLDPQEIYVLPDMELNAFATGRHVFFYEGLLLYYLDPIQFLIQTKQVPSSMTREAYTYLANRFSWRGDWDSIYFVLAHEAAHNLMAHSNERTLEGMRSQLQQLSSDATAYRKAVAEGRSAPGVKRYLGQSLLSFISGPERSRQKVSQEEEADAVASEILRRAGLRPDSGLIWLQRMSLLQGQAATGWQSVMNSLFCSTHPDRQQRMLSLQRNLGCLQYSGRLCAKHITYPLTDRLGMLRSDFAKLERYSEETNAIAAGQLKLETNVRQTVELKPNPKEASVTIDGMPVDATTVPLAVGRHVLTATRDGYRPARIAFAVFPDVAKATIKFKLKRCEKGKPCESKSPEEVDVEAEADSRIAAIKTEQLPNEVEEKRSNPKRKD